MEQRSAHILVVDDEATIRLTLDAILRRRGYAVTIASDGVEALALIEQQTFDLLLLDLKMPGLSGLEVAQRARVLQPAVGVLILTGSSQIAGLPEDPHVDQFGFMLKTASPQEVLDRVAAIIA